MRTAAVAALLALAWGADRGLLPAPAAAVAAAARGGAPRPDGFRYAPLFRAMRLENDGPLFRRRRDAPTPRPKRAGVRRLVVMGNSATAGPGLAAGESFPRRLEKRLGPAFEVVDLSAPGYTAAMLAAQYPEAASFSPDALLVCLDSTASELDLRRLDRSARPWDAPEPEEEEFAGAAYLDDLRAAARSLGLPPPSPLRARAVDRGFVADAGRLTGVYLRRLADAARRDRVPLRVAVLPQMMMFEGEKEWAEALLSAARGAGLPAWDLTPPFRAAPGVYRVAPGDPHMNARGHALVADLLEKEFRR